MKQSTKINEKTQRKTIFAAGLAEAALKVLNVSQLWKLLGMQENELAARQH